MAKIFAYTLLQPARSVCISLSAFSFWCVFSVVSTGIGDCLRAGILSHYVTSHPGQLSLAIPPWVGAMSTGDGYGHRWGRKRRELPGLLVY